MRTILIEFKQQNPHVTFAVASANPCSAEYLAHLGLDDIFDTIWSHRRKYPVFKTSVVRCTRSVPRSHSKLRPWRSKRQKADVVVWPLDSAEEDIWVCYAHIPLENIVFFDDLVENTEDVGRMLGVAGILVDVKSGLGADKLAEGLHRISEV